MSFVSDVYRPLTISRAAVERANSVSHFNAGDVLAREADAVYKDGLEHFAPHSCPESEWTPEQRQIAESRAALWRDLCVKSYNDVTSRRASWVPWTVAGPANYDARRNQKRCEAEIKAGNEWDEKRARFLENTRAMIDRATPLEKQLEQYRSGRRAESISFDDPHAADKLRAKIEGIKERRDEGKRQNAYYKKHGTMRGYPDLDDDRAASYDSEIAQSLHKVPCPAYELQNSLANIKRLEERLKEAEHRAESAAEDHAPQLFDGFRVEQDLKENRLRFFFDDKPDEETREILKKNGLHWSRFAQAWQRQLTPAALSVARRYIIPALLESGKYARAESLTPEQFADTYAN